VAVRLAIIERQLAHLEHAEAVGLTDQTEAG